MRVRHDPNAVRRDFATHPEARGIVAEFDVRPCRRGDLYAKVLVFKTNRDMGHFYRIVLGIRGRLARDVAGVVVKTGVEVRDRQGPGYRSQWVADARYFCVMGLVHRELGQEVLTHESVHAAMNYVDRVGRNTFGRHGEAEHERLTYPAGRIASGIAKRLTKLGL